MHEHICRILDRLSLLLAPGTGRRRAGGPPLTPDPTPWPDVRRTPEPLPTHRSPYCLHEPIDGSTTLLVRPYLAALDLERTHQARRRLALVLAADFGVDLDQHLIGMQGAAA
ncbi:hypothetical protein [Streptomyces sp. NPDC048665]|uniref:hypothetical protein n=1 Tax=Streptomyces sp. NPDC048665 TaxID=3155490 RepID=UPI0034140A67